MEGSLDALLLDLDDTILDDSSGYQAAWDAAVDGVLRAHPELERAAFVAELERVKVWFWSDPERNRRGRLDLLATRTRILSRALESLGIAGSEAAEPAARAHTEVRDRSQRLLPGAWEALEALRERVPALALVTNGAREPQRAKIERFGLAGFFDHIQVEGEFGLGKPEPGVYAHVLSVLDARPGRCLMVGDNFEADVLGAQRAGLHAAWVDKRGVGRPPRPGLRAHWTLRHIRELVERIDGAARTDPRRRRA